MNEKDYSLKFLKVFVMANGDSQSVEKVFLYERKGIFYSYVNLRLKSRVEFIIFICKKHNRKF